MWTDCRSILPDQSRYLVGLGEPTGIVLRIAFFSVYDDIENALALRQERGDDAKCFFELGRQTGRLGLIVSL